jgi:nicotinamide riboside transporter PnuC
MKTSDVTAMLVLLALVVAGIFLALFTWTDKKIGWKDQQVEDSASMEIDKTIGRYFALLWVSIGVLLVVVYSLQYLNGSTPFHTSIEMVLAGALVGLVVGKAY